MFGATDEASASSEWLDEQPIVLDTSEPRVLTTTDSLLAVVAHDLRTPLNSIVLSASMLVHRREHGELSDPTPLLKRILNEADRMSRLIGDLLEGSRIRNGTVRLSLAYALPWELLSTAVAEMEPLAAVRGIELAVRCNAGLPAVRVDRQRIQQVLANLLDNAIEFTPERGVVIVGAEQEADGLSFYVRDHGPGIDESDVPHLFEPFYRGSASRRPGTGLGLFIVRTIVEAHGGRVHVTTASARGSTFSFVIRHG